MCYISIAGTLDKGSLKIDFTVECESKIFNVMSSLSAFNLATLLRGSDNYKSQINSLKNFSDDKIAMIYS